MNQSYQIQGGDGGCYGPVFGPVVVNEIQDIPGDQNEYLLLRLSESIVVENNTIEYMVVSPRYVGDTLAKLKKNGCTVGVFRVLPGKQEDIRNGLNKDNAEYWAIGTIKPMKEVPTRGWS